VIRALLPVCANHHCESFIAVTASRLPDTGGYLQ
jgi:hypothetical protein